MPLPRTETTIGLVAATALMVTGCGNDDAPGTGQQGTDVSRDSPGTDEAIVIGEDPWIIVHDFSAGPEALLHLELEYLPDHDCLVVHGVNPETQSVEYSGAPVWPEYVQPLNKDGEVGVVDPDYGRLVDGESFTAGGSPGATESLPSAVEIPDEECLADGGFVPINHGSLGAGED